MKKINPKSPVSCTKSILIDSSAVEVWEVLTTIDKWPEWNKDITQSKLIGPLRAGTVFQWKMSGLKIQSILLNVTPYTNFSWWGKALGVRADHNWSVSELKKDTEIRVVENMDGFLPWLFKGTLTKILEKNMQNWLEQLKQECERKQRVAA